MERKSVGSAVRQARVPTQPPSLSDPAPCFFICQTGDEHPSSQVAIRLTEIMSAKKSAPFFLHSPKHKAAVGVVGCILHVELVKRARMGLKSSLYSICQAAHPGTCLSQEGAFVQFIHPKGAPPFIIYLACGRAFSAACLPTRGPFSNLPEGVLCVWWLSLVRAFAHFVR